MKNQSRVEKLKLELIKEIKDWFKKKNVTMVEFHNAVPIQVPIHNTYDMEDLGNETFLMNYCWDSCVADYEREEEQELESLSITEVETILNQLHLNRINIIPDEK